MPCTRKVFAFTIVRAMELLTILNHCHRHRGFVYHHATIPAVDAPHAVQQENQKAPQRNELKTPLGKMIVTRCRLVAPRADRCRTLPRSHVHFDAILAGTKASVLVDKSPMVMAVV